MPPSYFTSQPQVANFEIMIKNRIREIREKRNLSQEELAKLANTTQSQINRLETGDRGLTVAWLERLARGLSCDPLSLISDSMGISEEKGQINRQLLEKVIEEVEKVIFEEKIILDPSKKSKAIALIYNFKVSRKNKDTDTKNLKNEILLVLSTIGDNQ